MFFNVEVSYNFLRSPNIKLGTLKHRSSSRLVVTRHKSFSKKKKNLPCVGYPCFLNSNDDDDDGIISKDHQTHMETNHREYSTT